MTMTSDVSIGLYREYPALYVGDVVQSIHAIDGLPRAHGYWAAMLPEQEPRRALLLGVGGGTLANLLVQQWPAATVVGVDDDYAVVRLAAELGWFPPGFEVDVIDAFEYIAECRPQAFDYIGIDLFRGAEIAPDTFERRFLRDVRRVLMPHGTLVLNVFRDAQLKDRLAALHAVFSSQKRIDIGINALVHCSHHS